MPDLEEQLTALSVAIDWPTRSELQRSASGELPGSPEEGVVLGRRPDRHPRGARRDTDEGHCAERQPQCERSAGDRARGDE